MSNEKPIIFSGEMVRAILGGRKTQTRRVINPQPTSDGNDVWSWKRETFLSSSDLQSHLFHNVYGDKGSPYGAIYGDGTADRLWVRETWAAIYPALSPVPLEDCRIEYRADLSPDCTDYPGGCPAEEARGNPEAPKWRPSIYMPRWASRLTLELADIRIERLQDATLTDLVAEGCPTQHLPENCNGMSHAVYGWFESLWNDINYKRGYGWDTNPWVWVIEFSVQGRQASQPAAPPPVVA